MARSRTPIGLGRTLRRAVALLAALGPLAACAAAEAVTVCLPDIDAPPYLYRAPERTGLLQRLLTEAGRDAGLQVSVLRLPSARCQLALNTGEAQAMPLPAEDAHLAQLDFPVGAQGQVDSAMRLARIQFLLLHRRGEAAGWDGRALSPARVVVGVRRGVATLVERLSGLGAALDDRATANDQLLAKLSVGRIDLAAMSREEFQALAPGRPGIEALPQALIDTELHLAVSRRLSDAVRERLPAWRDRIARLRDCYRSSEPGS